MGMVVLMCVLCGGFSVMVVARLVCMVVMILCCVLAKGPQMGAFGLQQPQLGHVGGQTFDGAVKPGRHFRADPDDKICLGQGRRLTGTQLKAVCIRALVQQQDGLAQVTHRLRHQRLHRGDVGDHARHLGRSRGDKAGQRAGCQERYGITHWKPLPAP